jgi:GNAT superfamily N-acetyltransferase
MIPVRLTRRGGEDLETCVGLLAAVRAADGYPARWPDDPASWLTPDEPLRARVAWRPDPDQVVGHVCPCDAGAGASAAAWSAGAGVPVERLGVVSRLFVDPRVRREGPGRRLLLAARDEARRRDRHPVLEVLERDRAAGALYERLGWRLAGPPDPTLRRSVAPVR